MKRGAPKVRTQIGQHGFSAAPARQWGCLSLAISACPARLRALFRGNTPWQPCWCTLRAVAAANCQRRPAALSSATNGPHAMAWAASATLF
jgi:hypothetical protein